MSGRRATRRAICSRSSRSSGRSSRLKIQPSAWARRSVWTGLSSVGRASEAYVRDAGHLAEVLEVDHLGRQAREPHAEEPRQRHVQVEVAAEHDDEVVAVDVELVVGPWCPPGRRRPASPTRRGRRGSSSTRAARPGRASPRRRWPASGCCSARWRRCRRSSASGCVGMPRLRAPWRLEDGDGSGGAVDAHAGTARDPLGRARRRHDARDAELPAHDHGVALQRTDVDHDRRGGHEQRRPRRVRDRRHEHVARLEGRRVRGVEHDPGHTFDHARAARAGRRAPRRRRASARGGSPAPPTRRRAAAGPRTRTGGSKPSELLVGPAPRPASCRSASGARPRTSAVELGAAAGTRSPRSRRTRPRSAIRRPSSRIAMRPSWTSRMAFVFVRSRAGSHTDARVHAGQELALHLRVDGQRLG